MRRKTLFNDSLRLMPLDARPYEGNMNMKTNALYILIPFIVLVTWISSAFFVKSVKVPVSTGKLYVVLDRSNIGFFYFNNPGGSLSSPSSESYRNSSSLLKRFFGVYPPFQHYSNRTLVYLPLWLLFPVSLLPLGLRFGRNFAQI